MFTGIIEGLGKISNIVKKGDGMQLVIETSIHLSSVKIGDSIAVNGACLTAVLMQEKYFQAYLSPETCKMTTFGIIKIGDIVNIERALKLSDRINGHLVSGHIDGIGILKSYKRMNDAILLTFTTDKKLTKYMIKKGSIAVDGISLTINNCGNDFFEVSIIPHTAGAASIGNKKPGDKVNIETDMIGKYIEKFITGDNQKHSIIEKEKSKIDMEFLSRTGFLNL